MPTHTRVAPVGAAHASVPHAHATRHTTGHAPAAPHPAPTHAGPDPVVNPNGNAFERLIPVLQRAVAEEGYTEPTPIQAQAIPLLLEGRDVLGCAQTGTGKTAAFTLPMLQHLTQTRRPHASGRPRALILAPTRELAAQIGDCIRAYGRHTRITYAVIFGGVSQHSQTYVLRNGVDVVVATPGRLIDLMQQGFVTLDQVEYFVLDEADRMLDMGFLPDMRRVIAKLPAKRQSLFFSATLTRDALALARTLVQNAAHVSIAPEEPAVARIVQRVHFVDKSDKDALLVKVLSAPGIDKVLVFTQRKHIANRVTDRLSAARIPAVAIHGNKSQNARTQALSGFRDGRVRVLVATDIAARGIDVDGITHVINYELPNEAETYVHRIGRTARAGAAGDAVSFCCAEERDIWREIERLVSRPIPIERDQAFHSEEARLATGAAARPPPRTGGGGGGRGGPRGQRPSSRGTQHGYGSARGGQSRRS